MDEVASADGAELAVGEEAGHRHGAAQALHQGRVMVGLAVQALAAAAALNSRSSGLLPA